MRPFSELDLSAIITGITNALNDRVDKYTNDEIMANNLELLSDNCYEEFKIEPVEIFDEDFSKRTLSQGKIQRYIDRFFSSQNGSEYVLVDGIIATFCFPFNGYPELFRCRASTFSISGYPEIQINSQCIVMKYELNFTDIQTEADKEKILAKSKRDIDSIKQGINFANSDVNAFNSSLRDNTLHSLKLKKSKIEQFYGISKMFEVPITKSDYGRTHIPMERKIVPIAKAFKNEPFYCITEEEYFTILETIKQTGSSFERTPTSYKSLHEEDLRNFLLCSLNAMYRGGASGEAFRNKGKTDICIEKESRAAFIAECKMWRGQSEISEAIVQLNGYLTWRDCKVALIYFSRNRDFFKVLEIANVALKSLPNLRNLVEKDKNEFDCRLISSANEGQLINVRVMIFDLYSD